MSTGIDGMPDDRLGFYDVEDEPRRLLPPIQGYANVSLVSLEQAVQHVTEYKNDLLQQAAKAKEKCETQPAHGLSIDESAAILLYTGENSDRRTSVYIILNSALRSERRDLLKPWFHYLKLLITGLSKIPSKPGTVLRGVKKNLSADYPKGSKPIWWAFSSTTTSIDVLEKGPFYGKTGERTLFKIDCRSGKPIRQHSQYPKEYEILLMAATQFEVVSCINQGQGQYIINLKEIEPEDCLIELPPWPGTVRSLIDAQSSSAIDLADVRLIDRDMDVVCTDAIVKKRCIQLLLSNTKCKLQTVSILAQGIGQSTALEVLNLSKNYLSDNDLRPLFNELMNGRTHQEIVPFLCFKNVRELPMPPIKELHLDENSIGDQGLDHLVEVMKVKLTLNTLSLKKNKISNTGIQRLSDYLSSPQARLMRLYVDDNELIGDVCVDYLINMLRQNNRLQELSLTDCSLTADGRKRIRDASQTKKKFTLKL